MSLIKTIEPQNATGELAELYAKISQIRGVVPNSSKLWSQSPELLKQQLAFISYYMNHKSLSAQLLAAIRMLVSTENSCEYCVDFNTAMLINSFGWSHEDVEALKNTKASVKLSDKEQKMLDFVLKSVKEKTKTSALELDKLSEMGWDESDILDALQHGARMSAIDIVFNVLGVEKDF